MRAVLAVFMLVPLCACVHDKVTDWDKPGGIIASEFYADSNDCRQNARRIAALYNKCMEDRGYRRLSGFLGL